MTQDEINEAEWENPGNWSDGPSWMTIYFSKKEREMKSFVLMLAVAMMAVSVAAGGTNDPISVIIEPNEHLDAVFADRVKTANLVLPF